MAIYSVFLTLVSVLCSCTLGNIYYYASTEHIDEYHPNFPVMNYVTHNSLSVPLGWEGLGHTSDATPVLVPGNDGKTDIFIRGANDSQIWHSRADSNFNWGQWRLPVAPADVAGRDTLKVLNFDASDSRYVDRIVVSTNDVNNIVFYSYFQSKWHGYSEDSFKSPEDPAVAGTPYGSFHTFAVGYDGLVYKAYVMNARKIYDFSPQPGIATQGGLAAVSFQSPRGNHVLVFCVKAGEWFTGYLHYAEYIDNKWNREWVNTNQFTDDVPSFSVVGAGFVMAVGDGAGRTLIRSYHGVLGWSDWQNLGGRTVHRPAVASNGIYTTVFTVGVDRLMYYRSSSDGTSWSLWQNISGPCTTRPAAVYYNNASHVFTLSESNQVMKYSIPIPI